MDVERLWWPRLRWRRKGAWQWPAFFALTAVDAVVIALLPFYGEGPDALGAVLLAGFLNLFVVAVAAPLAGRRLRRRRPDLPRLVANDYAGTALLAVACAGLLAAGLAHRPAADGARDERRQMAASVHDYVVLRAPDYRGGLAELDAVRLDEGLWRACVPGPDPRRWLCLFVSTAQHPPGITLDHAQVPNVR
jgi:hypothetical protein